MGKKNDFTCLEILEKPVERVNSNDLQTLRIMDVERRMRLWFEIRENLGRYEDGECGDFYGDIHRRTKAGFFMAMLKLAATFSMNEEKFVEVDRVFSRDEIDLIKKLEKYNSFDIKSTADVISEIRGGDRTTTEYIMNYMDEMRGGWVGVLNNSEIKLPVREAIKETMKKRLNVLEAGVLELMKQTGGMEGVFRDVKVSQGSKQVLNFNVGGDMVMTRSTISMGGIDLGRKCSGCNREVEEDVKFCPECGTKI